MFNQWDGVLVTQNGAYGACVVTFFSEFYYEGFNFFRLVLAPAGWAPADWAN